MNLRFQVGLTISLIGISCLLVMSYMLIDYKRKSIDQEIEAGTRVAIQLLQAIVPSPIERAQVADPMTSLLDYLRSVGRVRANEVRVYDVSGTLIYESPLSDYKQGRWAPEWFATLVAPDTGEIRLQMSDGAIVITPDSSRSVLDAWDELWRFALFIFVFFVLLIAAVYLMLGRLLKPMKDIVAAMTEIEQGNFDTRLQDYDLPEFNAISHTFNRMAGSMQDALALNARIGLEEQQRLAAQQALEQSRKFTQLVQVKLEEERRLIARELHDELGQCVTAIKSIGTAISARSENQEETRKNAQVIVDVASHIYGVVHDMIKQLRPSALDHLGLTDAMSELIAQFRRQHPQLTITLHCSNNLDNFDENLNITVYRLVQESLTNVAKHAEASSVSVAIKVQEANPSALEIRVYDDGKGITVENSEKQRFGLLGIKERVQAFGGSVVIQPGPDGGTVMEAVLPMTPEVK